MNFQNIKAPEKHILVQIQFPVLSGSDISPWSLHMVNLTVHSRGGLTDGQREDNGDTMSDQNSLLTSLLCHMSHVSVCTQNKQLMFCMYCCVLFSYLECYPLPSSVVFTSSYGTPDKSNKRDLFLDFSSESTENIQANITFPFSSRTVLILTFYIAITLF